MGLQTTGVFGVNNLFQVDPVRIAMGHLDRRLFYELINISPLIAQGNTPLSASLHRSPRTLLFFTCTRTFGFVSSFAYDHRGPIIQEFSSSMHARRFVGFL